MSATLATLRAKVGGDRSNSPENGNQHRTLILGAGAVVLVGALVTWLLAFSSVFGVRTVEVTGTHTLAASQIRSAAAVAHGSPLLRLNTAAITHRVQALADVASVTVSTSFPSTVVIAVTERVPVGYVKVGTRFGLIDKTGRQYRTVGSAPGTLPQFVV
ncbi:MAG: FtsQ-type POTRA domain-containing protein, partial [Jatrophihabitantaceae bacterium]